MNPNAREITKEMKAESARQDLIELFTYPEDFTYQEMMTRLARISSSLEGFEIEITEKTEKGE